MDMIETIFFEKQDGLLCGQHVLNNLLQSPYFTAVDLAQIAQELDSEESKLGMKGENYNDQGFFSVQVLNRALKVWNIEMIPLGTQKLANYNFDGLIINNDQHWLALRRFGKSNDRWYNLNSTQDAPSLIENVQTFVSKHPNVFVIQGEFPDCLADEYASRNPKPFDMAKFKGSGQRMNLHDDKSQQDMRLARLERFNKLGH
jgi:ataxin-3